MCVDVLSRYLTYAIDMQPDEPAPTMRSSSMVTSPQPTMDIEAGDIFFDNSDVQSFSWSGITVEVKTKEGVKPLLQNNSGSISSGQILALMGPSGSGKSTLLNVLAKRSRLPYKGSICVNGCEATTLSIQQLSSYVEQDDVQLGGLTVAENIEFAARLSTRRRDRGLCRRRCQDVLQSLGLFGQKDMLVSPVLRAGISSGQKKRLSLATALVTGPKILFLDEPTSGLDSVASHQVMEFLASIAKRHKIIIVASIHQPSSATFRLFDKVMLISRGQTCYCGDREKVVEYFAPIPPFTNPAEHMLYIVNIDFGDDQLDDIVERWRISEKTASETATVVLDIARSPTRQPQATWILLQRSWIKAYRDPLVYGMRLLVKTALSVVVGTAWLRLDYNQNSIQPFVNCIFFSSAFMAVMAIAYAPAVIEDIRMLQKEHANGLYGPLEFMIANFVTGVPWLFLISLIFGTIVYWLFNFFPDGQAYAMFTMWLFIDLLVAESIVVLVSAVVSQFVTALALTAFAYGLWLAADGFLVPINILNSFWKYAFYYINFQAYVFQGMMLNQFKTTVYNCETLTKGWHCMLLSDLADQGQIRGTAVLDAYSYPHDERSMWHWVGYSLAILFVHRFIGLLILFWRVR